jgi:hypothetical protein
LRAQPPAAEHVGCHCRQAERIKRVAKTLQRRPAIKRPEPTASATRRKKFARGESVENMPRTKDKSVPPQTTKHRPHASSRRSAMASGFAVATLRKAPRKLGVVA